MTDPKHFLERWSRRKLQSADAPVAGLPGEPEPPSNAKPAGGSTNLVTPAAVDVDLEKLPPLESIGPETDIRAFLQRGVPATLSRAALRRAWSADPAIRDFIGLSENSWDFTAPDSLPGFGSLTADEIRRVAAQLFGESDEASSPLAGVAPPAQPAPPLPESGTVRPRDMRVAALEEPKSARRSQTQPGKDSDTKPAVMDSARQSAADGATQHQDQNGQEIENHSLFLPRRHGGALPE